MAAARALDLLEARAIFFQSLPALAYFRARDIWIIASASAVRAAAAAAAAITTKASSEVAVAPTVFVVGGSNICRLCVTVVAVAEIVGQT